MTPLASPADDENHPGACGTALSTASYPWLLGELEATGSYACRGPTKMLQLYKFSRQLSMPMVDLRQALTARE